MKNPFKTSAVRDPVCGMDVIPGRTAFHAGHNGKEFHFCSSECKQAFELFPGRFTALPAAVEADAREKPIVRDAGRPAAKSCCCKGETGSLGGACH